MLWHDECFDLALCKLMRVEVLAGCRLVTAEIFLARHPEVRADMKPGYVAAHELARAIVDEGAKEYGRLR